MLSNRAAVRTPGNCLHKVLGYTELKTSVEDVKKWKAKLKMSHISKPIRSGVLVLMNHNWEPIRPGVLVDES